MDIVAMGLTVVSWHSNCAEARLTFHVWWAKPQPALSRPCITVDSQALGRQWSDK